MLEAGFYALFIVITAALGIAFRKAALCAGSGERGAAAVQLRYGGFIILWVIYLSIMVSAGAFKELKSPPSILLFIILPAFTIITIFHLVRRALPLIDGFSLSAVIGMQSFRIFVELLIWGVYTKGLVPKEVTFEGWNFDILAGLSAPLIAWLWHKKRMARGLVLAWNVVCLLLLANVVVIFNTLVMKPQLWGYDSPPIQPGFTTVPYLYIAAVFMPLAMFLHILAIRKCLRRR